MSIFSLTTGGKVIVFCHSPVGEPEKTSQLILDYVTDAVLEHNDIHGEPYVSPDGRHIITIDEVGNNMRVFRVTDQGEYTLIIILFHTLIKKNL